MDASYNNRVIITPTARFDCKFDLKNYPYQNSNDGVLGYFFKEEGEFYCSLVKKINNGKILEIGSMNGLSISYIADICKANNNSIYSIDLCYQDCLVSNLERWELDYTYIVGRSDASSNFIQDNCLDLIFIDGWHDYNTVRNDILLYLPKMKSTSVMFGHDIDNYWPDVQLAVESIFLKYNKKNRFWWVENPISKIIKFL